MTRSHAPTVLTAALCTACAATVALAQQTATTVIPTPRIVGPTGPGLQPQVNTSPYQQPTATPAARGVNPFAWPTLAPVNVAARRLGPRAVVAPVVFAPAPVPGVANNPRVFNPGFAAPFPVPLAPAAMPVQGAAFNPVFVSQRGVVSAYYVPPSPIGSLSSATNDDRFVPVTPSAPDADPWYGTFLRAGEHRFLPWVW